MRNFTKESSTFTIEEIKAEARRLRAAEKRERYRRDPERQREATRRYWQRKALASLEAQRIAAKEDNDGERRKD